LHTRPEKRRIYSVKSAIAVASVSRSRKRTITLRPLRLPDPHRLIRPRRRQPRPIRRERHRGDRRGMTAQHQDFLPEDRIPDADRPIGAAGRQPLAVGGVGMRRSGCTRTSPVDWTRWGGGPPFRLDLTRRCDGGLRPRTRRRDRARPDGDGGSGGEPRKSRQGPWP
jgi:hypothetical protein